MGSVVVRVLFGTISIKEIPAGYSQNLERQGKHAIYAFWHAHMLLPAYVGRQRNVKVLISQHRDGEYIAQAVQRLGYGVARGSTTRGGAKALLRMIKTDKRGIGIFGNNSRWTEGPQICSSIRSNTISAEDSISYYSCYGVSWLSAGKCQVGIDFVFLSHFQKRVLFYGNPIMIPSKLKKSECRGVQGIIREGPY